MLLNDIYSPNLYKNMYFVFSYLFSLLNLICDSFSLFVGIILSASLLTELEIDRLGIYNVIFQCLIKPMNGASTKCNTRT